MTDKEIWNYNYNTSIDDVFDNNMSMYDALYKSAKNIVVSIMHYTEQSIPCHSGVVSYHKNISHKNEIDLTEFINVEKLDEKLKDINVDIDMSKISFVYKLFNEYPESAYDKDKLNDADQDIVNKLVKLLILCKCNKMVFFDTIKSVLKKPDMSEYSGRGGIAGYNFNHYIKGPSHIKKFENDCDVIAFHTHILSHSKEGHLVSVRKDEYKKKLKNGKYEYREYKYPKYEKCMKYDTLPKTFNIEITFNK